MARDPLNMNIINVDQNELEILSIGNIPEYDIEDYDLYDEKDRGKFLDDIERACRMSYEYRQMVKYLRENMNMNKCTFYQNVNNIDTFKIKIHIHHEPLTLYDICKIVLNKRVKNSEHVSIWMIAKEVMFLHYKLLVGLIPLAETPHQLVHNQYLFVPADIVLGHYKEFVDMYEEYMEPEQIYIFNNILEATKCYNDDGKHILNKKFIYIDASGAYAMPKLEDVVVSLQNRISDVLDSTNLGPDNNKIIIKPFTFDKK